jgi:hypothetical protein
MTTNIWACVANGLMVCRPPVSYFRSLEQIVCRCGAQWIAENKTGKEPPANWKDVSPEELLILLDKSEMACTCQRCGRIYGLSKKKDGRLAVAEAML